MKININADIGESHGKFVMGNDAELMPMIGSANVACGMHAGDPTIMVQTVRLALDNNVSIGAHPGFNDIWGFGRRQIRMRPLDLEYLVTYLDGVSTSQDGETWSAHFESSTGVPNEILYGNGVYAGVRFYDRGTSAALVDWAFMTHSGFPLRDLAFLPLE